MILDGIPTEKIIGFSFDYIPGEFYTSILVMLLIVILAAIVGIKARKVDPLEKPKGIVNIAEMLVEFTDKQVDTLMGPRFKDFGGYILPLGMYIILGFIFGIMGFPTPFTYWGITLSIALCTFIWIHATAVRFNHWSYFKRYVEPVFVFLPINLVSMWSPVISLSFRLFGNALAGYCITSLVYYGFAVVNSASEVIFSYAFVISPFLHAYFDVFDGVIQMMIFTMLTMIFVAQEAPNEEELLEQQLA